MTDHGHHLIVAVGRKRHHVGPQFRHHRRHGAEGGVVGGAAGREHPHGALEHAAVSSVEPFEFAAGHRVTADEPGVVDGLGHAVLHAADVGDQTVRVGQYSLHLVDQREHGGGDECDFGARIEALHRDEAEIDSLLGTTGQLVVAAHMPAALGEGARDGTPDETETGHVRPTSF